MCVLCIVCACVCVFSALFCMFYAFRGDLKSGECDLCPYTLYVFVCRNITTIKQEIKLIIKGHTSLKDFLLLWCILYLTVN